MKQFAVKMMHEAGQNTAEVHLYNAIGSGFKGGVSAADFVGELKNLDESVHIEMHYNTGGGSPFEAVAMATALAAHPGGYTAIVDGLCASAATIPFSVAKVRRMRRGSMLMIHNPSQQADGLGSLTADDLRKVAAKLDAVTASAVGFYAESTGKSEQSILKMMNDETWLSPDEARQEGFVTETIEADAVAASVDLSEFKNVPEAALSLVDEALEDTEQPESPNPERTVVMSTASVEQPVPTKTPVAETVTMTVDQYEALKNPQVEVDPTQMAVEAERTRVSDIHAVCEMSGIDAATAKKFVDEGTAVSVVQMAALTKVTNSNTPASDAGGEDVSADDVRMKSEYEELVSMNATFGMTFEEYKEDLEKGGAK